MKLTYDHETDSLYIQLAEQPGADSVVITDDLVMDVDAEGRPVGLDVQYASKGLNLADVEALQEFVLSVTRGLRAA
ncbi:MAG: DUF2283 domain-containing protein [bacterium]